MNRRAFIARTLWSGAILTVLLILSGALWAVLNALGDRAGGQGAKGVFLVAAVCWLLNFVTLVVLLALAQLDSREQFSGETAENETE